MKLVLVCPLCFLLMQTSVESSILGLDLKETQLDNKLNLEYRINRGVTYISQPSSEPASSQAATDTRGSSISNGQNLNYDIFESPDELPGGAGGPVRVAPAPIQPADSQLPPKFGPVLFPDEEAAAQNQGSGEDGKNVQGGQNNQNTKAPIVTNPPQGQENHRNNGIKNTGRSHHRENSSNRGNNSSHRNGNSKSNAHANNRQNENNGNRNGNNGNGNGNGRGNGRKNCSFPVEMIFCILGR